MKGHTPTSKARAMSFATRATPKGNAASRKQTTPQSPGSSALFMDWIARRRFDKVIAKIKTDPSAASRVLRREETSGIHQNVLKSTNGNRALHEVCRNQPTLHVVETVLEAYPQAISIPGEWGYLPLHFACVSGAPAPVVAHLLSIDPAGARVADSHQGRLPLHLAAHWGASEDVLLCLLQAYPKAALMADQSGSDGTGKLPLALAQELNSSLLAGGQAQKDRLVALLEKAPMLYGVSRAICQEIIQASDDKLFEIQGRHEQEMAELRSNHERSERAQQHALTEEKEKLKSSVQLYEQEQSKFHQNQISQLCQQLEQKENDLQDMKQLLRNMKNMMEEALQRTHLSYQFVASIPDNPTSLAAPSCGRQHDSTHINIPNIAEQREASNTSTQNSVRHSLSSRNKNSSRLVYHEVSSSKSSSALASSQHTPKAKSYSTPERMEQEAPYLSTPTALRHQKEPFSTQLVVDTRHSSEHDENADPASRRKQVYSDEQPEQPNIPPRKHTPRQQHDGPHSHEINDAYKRGVPSARRWQESPLQEEPQQAMARNGEWPYHTNRGNQRNAIEDFRDDVPASTKDKDDDSLLHRSKSAPRRRPKTPIQEHHGHAAAGLSRNYLAKNTSFSRKKNKGAAMDLAEGPSYDSMSSVSTCTPNWTTTPGVSMGSKTPKSQRRLRSNPSRRSYPPGSVPQASPSYYGTLVASDSDPEDNLTLDSTLADWE